MIQTSLQTAGFRTRTIPPQRLRTGTISPQRLRTRTIPPQRLRTGTIPPQRLRTGTIPPQRLPTRTIPPQAFCLFSPTVAPAVQLPQQCYNFPSSATTSQAVLQLPLSWHCPSKPLIVCLIITDSSTPVLSTAFVVTVFPLML